MSCVPDFSKLPFAPAQIQFENVRAEPGCPPKALASRRFTAQATLPGSIASKVSPVGDTVAAPGSARFSGHGLPNAVEKVPSAALEIIASPRS